MTLVVDASMVVSGLVDSGPAGSWAASEELAAPHLMHAEAANILRRGVLRSTVTADTASLAYTDLTALRVELCSYVPLASRIWELRANLTPYDAWYVALAEALAAPLAPSDLRLTHAPGPRCGFTLPPSTT